MLLKIIIILKIIIHNYSFKNYKYILQLWNKDGNITNIFGYTKFRYLLYFRSL